MRDNSARQQFVRVCDCGCGQPTRLFRCNDAAHGRVKNQPARYLQGHAPTKYQQLSVEDRFWSKVERGAGCWNWQGSLTVDGYGRCYLPGRVARRAHRFVWERTNGPIPEGMDVLHTCDNRRCCNPAHLFLGTNLDNFLDMVEKGRQARGYRMPTHDEVRSIRRALAAGGSLRVVALQHGRSIHMVWRIAKGHRWANVA